jgi:hypothetical protein
MGDWMAYLYKQQPEPMNATGVPVTLSILDPNKNYYVIGITTSDINGQYALPFKPDVPGTYTITATFGGTNSYYSSSAETHLLVGENAATPTPQPTQAPSAADLYFIPISAVVVVLVVIVLAMLALMMMKKP